MAALTGRTEYQGVMYKHLPQSDITLFNSACDKIDLKTHDIENTLNNALHGSSTQL